MRTSALVGLVIAVFCMRLGVRAAFGNDSRLDRNIPVRGLHLSAPSKKDLAMALEFIRDVLPRERVNTLILEFDYNFDFHSRPEFGDPAAIGRDEVRQIARLCRQKKIELIPQINCLGHQSWAKPNGAVLCREGIRWGGVSVAQV